MIIDEFSKYQIEWLTSHCDIEFNKEEEDLIIRFIKDTAEMYQRENECEDCISRQAVLDLFSEKCDAVRPYHEVWQAVKMLPPVKPQQPVENWKFYYDHGYTQAKRDLLCEDCISRAEALKHSHIEYDEDGEGHRVVYFEDIENLPSVTPERKKEEE